MGSFTRKGLRFKLQLADGETFGDANNSTQLVIDSLWAQVTSDAIVGSLPTVEVDIYGMRQSDMDALTTIFFLQNSTLRVNNNYLTIEANNDVDSPGGWGQIFSGQIYEACPDFSGAPNTRLHVSAAGGYLANLAKLDDYTINGNADVEAAVTSIKNKMPGSYNVVNLLKGSRTIANSLTLDGTAIDQFDKLQTAAKVNITIQGDQIYITDKKVPFADGDPWLVSADTGMIGWPTFTSDGLVVRCLFNRGAISLFRQLNVQSQLTYANGLWCPYQIRHNLSTHADFPSWESAFSCFNANG